MSFLINRRAFGDILVIDMLGRLEFGDPTHALHSEIDGALAGGCRRFVFNLARVERVDSAGLGALNRCSKAIGKRGGQVCMFGLTQRVDDLMVITKLSTIFRIFPDEQKALASLGATANGAQTIGASARNS
jgi:anti-sigma B factor antagonist